MSNLDIGIHASTADVANDNRPLTEQEIQTVRRLLSDPFSFPLEFKTWLVAYLETSDLSLPMGSIMGLSVLLGITGAGEGSLGVLPAGLIFPYGGASAPLGSLLCDGSAYSKTGEARLFAAIGTTYGSPTSDTFSVPDLRGRVPVMKGVTPDHDTLNKSDNLGVASRNVKHGHTTDFTPETPVGFGSYGVTGGADANVYFGAAANFGELGEHTHGSNLTRVGINGQSEGPAFLTLNFVIVA